MMVTTKMIRYVLIAIRAIAVVTATIILIRAFDARSLPDLYVWHEVHFDNEFDAHRDQDVNTLAAYLVKENAVFDELQERYTPKRRASRLSAPAGSMLTACSIHRTTKEIGTELRSWYLRSHVVSS